MICPAYYQAVYRFCLSALKCGGFFHQFIYIIGYAELFIKRLYYFNICWIIIIVKVKRVGIHLNIRAVISDFIT